jgi:hypothetical protein
MRPTTALSVLLVVIAVAACKTIIDPAPPLPSFGLTSINAQALPTTVCPGGQQCTLRVESATISFVSDTQLHYVEHYRTSATAPDSLVDEILTYRRDNTAFFIMHPAKISGATPPTDTGFIQLSGQLLMLTWRGSTRFDFLYSPK